MTDKCKPEPPNDAEPLSDEKIKELEKRVAYAKSAGQSSQWTMIHVWEGLFATIRARDAALGSKSAECERAWDQARKDFHRAQAAESERDALADQLAAVVDWAEDGASCLLCANASQYHQEKCPLSNPPSIVQARRDQFEKMKAENERMLEGLRLIENTNGGTAGKIAREVLKIKEAPDDK